MNRATKLLLTVSVALPAACGSSGNSAGPTLLASEPTQSPPTNANDPILNINDPLTNSNQPPPNSNQAPSNPNQAAPSAPPATGACPLFCGAVDARCAGACANACTVLATGFVPCASELRAFFACAQGAGLSCNQAAKLEIPQGTCQSERGPVVACIEALGGDNQSSTVTPVPGNGAGGESSSDGGR